MGFRCKTFYVVGGSDEFPTGNTDELRRSRSETILTKLAQTLISCDCGWQLDTSKNATDTAYANIPCTTETTTYPGLFFINTISGCKLFMSFFGGPIQNYGIKDFSGGDLFLYKGSKYHGGVCASIIPHGSNSTFGDPSSSTFIPADATRICGTFYRNTFDYSSIRYASACSPQSGWAYKYWVFATPYVVGFYVNHTTDGAMPGCYRPIYMTGKIFGAIFHDEIHPNAKYGTFVFRDQSGDDEGWAINLGSSMTVLGTSISIIGQPNSPQNYYTASFPYASISRENGTWILGSNGNNYNVLARCEDIMHLSEKVFTASGTTTRWIPISIVYIASDLSVGVKPGDGAKGIIDTDLFRVAICSRGDAFDGGKFYCLEAPNLLTGIDPQDQPV